MTDLAIHLFTPREIAVIKVPATVIYRMHAMRAIQAEWHSQIAVHVALMAHIAFLDLAIMTLQLGCGGIVIGDKRSTARCDWPDGMG